MNHYLEKGRIIKAELENLCGFWVAWKGVPESVFLEIVPNRKAETLLPILEKWILPGSRIITDGWVGYNDLSNVDHGIYKHVAAND